MEIGGCLDRMPGVKVLKLTNILVSGFCDPLNASWEAGEGGKR